MRQCSVYVGSIFVGFVFINAFVDEDTFQGSKHHTLQQFSTANFQLALQQGFGVVDIAFEHVFDGDETRSVFVDDAAVGGDAHFAIGEGVEGIEGFVARHTGRKMDENLHILCGEVLDLTDFDAPFVGGFLDAFAERVYRFSVGEFGDGDGFAIALFHSCTHLDGSSAKSVVIARNIDESAGLEIGIEGEIFFLQIRDGGLAEFTKVVGKDFSTQPHGDAFCALCEQEGEFHW